MIPVPALWAPILLSAVAVFIVSSILHMTLPWHRDEYRQLPDEEGLLGAMREAGVSPGRYFFPFAQGREMGSPEQVAKQARGPVGFATVLPPGAPLTARHLAWWFLYCLLVGASVAYLAGQTLSPGVSRLAVLRVVGTAAFLAYGIAEIPGSIWQGRPWGVTLKHVLDGFLYATVTAGAFGWLWPG